MFPESKWGVASIDEQEGPKAERVAVCRVIYYCNKRLDWGGQYGWIVGRWLSQSGAEARR